MLGSDEGGALPVPVDDVGTWPAGVGAGFVKPPVAVGGVKPVGPKRRLAGKPPLNQSKKKLKSTQ